MTSIDTETLLTVIYVLVDDWYKAVGYGMKEEQQGAQGVFSNSEMLTLMVVQDYIPYPGETQYVAHIRANYGNLFPKLVDQSQYNRRARSLAGMVEALR
jgi:hypothetical protein